MQCYRIFYKIEDQEIFITHVFNTHQSRNQFFF